MAVTAYASANVAPQANPSEPAIVTQASLPALPQLYGDAVDTLDGAPVWVWTWSIISTNYTGAPSITTPAAERSSMFSPSLLSRSPVSHCPVAVTPNLV